MTKLCVHQDPGERSNDPTRDWARLACECAGASCGGVGWPRPAAESEALTTAVLVGRCLVLMKEVTITTITPTIVWSQAKLQGENTAPTHQQKIGLKIYWAWPGPQSKTQLPLNPVPPIRKLEQVSYPHPSEGRRNENHNYRNLTKLITLITTMSNVMKLWAMPSRATQDSQSWWRESSDKTWSTGEGDSKAL